MHYSAVVYKVIMYVFILGMRAYLFMMWNGSVVVVSHIRNKLVFVYLLLFL